MQDFQEAQVVKLITISKNNQLDFEQNIYWLPQKGLFFTICCIMSFKMQRNGLLFSTYGSYHSRYGHLVTGR